MKTTFPTMTSIFALALAATVTGMQPTSARNFFEAAAHTAGQMVTNPGKAAEQAVKDTVKTGEKAVKDTAKTGEKAVKDTVKTTEKAAKDSAKTFETAWQDTADAGKALAKFTEQQLKSKVQSLSDAERRIREGKLVDAAWHFSTDSVRQTSENAGEAAHKSKVLRAAGAVAATAYGGPGGAAAYAAWYTYSQTKDLNLALKAGLIAGAMSVTVPAGTGIEGQIAAGAAKGATAAVLQGGDVRAIKDGLISGAAGAAVQSAANMPAGTTAEIAKKAIVSGAVGGIAVAAAGGNQDAVKAAFLQSGGQVVVQYAQSGVNSATARLVRDADTHCVSAVGAKCTTVINAAKESSAAIKNAAATVRGIANEQFAISWTQDLKAGNAAPSVVLTYSNGPLQISERFDKLEGSMRSTR